MLNNYHPVAQQITNLLIKSNCWYQTFEHHPVKTSEEASKVRSGYSIEQGAKAIILSVKKSETNKKFVMVVIPGNLRFDSEKVKKVLDVKHIRFATEEEVSQITGGVLPGGVPPFGHLFDLEVIADVKVLENEKIIFNAGDRSFSVGLYSKDYKTLANPRVESITSD